MAAGCWSSSMVQIKASASSEAPTPSDHAGPRRVTLGELVQTFRRTQAQLAQEFRPPTRRDHGHTGRGRGAGDQEHLVTVEGRVSLCRGGEFGVDVGDELRHLVGLEHRLADHGGLVFPRLEEGVLAGLRNGRRNGRQLLVGVLVEARIGSDNEIGLPVRRSCRLEPRCPGSAQSAVRRRVWAWPKAIRRTVDCRTTRSPRSVPHRRPVGRPVR